MVGEPVFSALVALVLRKSVTLNFPRGRATLCVGDWLDVPLGFARSESWHTYTFHTRQFIISGGNVD